ncbi:MAG: diacylglycerol kinase family lipid kinase [Actinomycetota bacterium]|nr:diacylglycerol kinase family lipid kinase [Actinomycetota bacterium]
MADPQVAALGVVFTVLLVFAIAVLLALRVRRVRPPGPQPFDTEPANRPLAAVVVNPTKFVDLEPVRATITSVCTALGWAEPLWLETTEADPGTGQSTAALQAGVDVVLACGGDGTVRTVAQVLAGTGVALGLLPAGTGNLLARNLDMHLNDIEGATRIALTGDERAVDVGRILIDDDPEERVFLVMAGMGFDAAIMANAPEALKARVGALAYVIAALRALKGQQTRVRLEMDGAAAQHRRIRTIVVGNCGRLQGGLVLMPGAELDDGLLDVVAIAPKGIMGWLAVTGRVLTRRRKGHHRVEHWQAKLVTITADSPQPAQLDGDPIGDARVMEFRADRGALVVRVAAPVTPARAFDTGGDA